MWEYDVLLSDGCQRLYRLNERLSIQFARLQLPLLLPLVMAEPFPVWPDQLIQSKHSSVSGG